MVGREREPMRGRESLKKCTVRPNSRRPRISEDKGIDFDASASRYECPSWTKRNRDRILNVNTSDMTVVSKSILLKQNSGVAMCWRQTVTIMWSCCVLVWWRWYLGLPVGPIACRLGANCSTPFCVTLVVWTRTTCSQWKCLQSIWHRLIKIHRFVSPIASGSVLSVHGSFIQ